MNNSKDSTLFPPQSISYKANIVKKITYIISLSCYISRQENISRSTQYAEIIFLYLVKRIGPMLYYEASLWRRSYSLRQKMRFLNSVQYLKRINELNDRSYRKFSNDKLAEKAILTLFGVPTAEFIGFFHPFNGSDPNNHPLTNTAQLAQALTEHVDRKICFKLTEGWGGDGFIAAYVSAEGNQVYLSVLPENKAMTVDVFFTRYLQHNYHQGLVVEVYIKQHPIVKSLNKTSVNTLRMWVIQRENNVKFIGAFLRVGRKNQIVDNATQGGVLCLIDQETGRLTVGRNTEIIPSFFDVHPDTGVQLTGIKLPFWSECIKLGKSSLRVFPHTNFVGLDIAFSTSGPVIIELNQEPDKVSARVFSQPLADLLDIEHIDEPNFK